MTNIIKIRTHIIYKTIPKLEEAEIKVNQPFTGAEKVKVTNLLQVESNFS